MTRLFISYSHKRSEGIKKLTHRLKNEGYEYWQDVTELHISDHWKQEVENAMKGCHGVILCLVLSIEDSEPIQFEVQTAIRLKIPIFPVQLTSIENVAECLNLLGLSSEIIASNLSGHDTWSKEFRKLLRGLEHEGLYPSLSRYDGMSNFNAAFVQEDYLEARHWLKRMRASKLCDQDEFDCDVFEKILEARIDRQVEEEMMGYIGEEYELMMAMSDYAPPSFIWSWLNDFLDTYREHPDLDNIQQKIRDRVGIKDSNLQILQVDAGVQLQWTMPTHAVSLKIVRRAFAQTPYVPDAVSLNIFRQTFPQYSDIPDDEMERLIQIFQTTEAYEGIEWYNEKSDDLSFRRGDSEYIDVNVEVGKRYTYTVECVYLDGWNKELLIKESPISIII